MRLIDADALKRDICQYCNDVYSDAPCEPSDCEHMRIIDSQATIDAVEVVHGWWESDAPDKHGYKKPRCSVCGEFHLFMWSDYASCKYCPNCGAQMTEKGNPNDKRTDSTDRA